jgi:hypothetical protein
VPRRGAIRLGEGEALDFSPDMRSVLTVVYGPPSRLSILPIGPGEVKALPNPEGLTISAGSWLPDDPPVAGLGDARRALVPAHVLAAVVESLRGRGDTIAPRTFML